jgi:molybdopterin converting factor small subunit
MTNLAGGENERMACVRYWAGAREVAGTPEQSLPASSLGELLAAVRAEHGDPIARLIEVGILLVDGERVLPGADQPLVDSSTVEILPPFAGG